MVAWVTPLLSSVLETFWTNPQFRLTLLEPDEEDEDEEGPWGGWGATGSRGPTQGGRNPKCTVLLSLIQRNRRRLRAQGLMYLTVGFHVFQVGPQAEQRSRGTERVEGREAKEGSRGVRRGWGRLRGAKDGDRGSESGGRGGNWRQGVKERLRG